MSSLSNDKNIRKLMTESGAEPIWGSAAGGVLWTTEVRYAIGQQCTE